MKKRVALYTLRHLPDWLWYCLPYRVRRWVVLRAYGEIPA